MTTSKKKLALILAVALIILVGLLGILMVPPSPPPISPQTPPQTHTLTITHTIGGTTHPAPGNYTYPEGTLVTVNATAFTGYVFNHWELDGSKVASAPSIDATMDANHTVHAVFKPLYTLTIISTAGGTTDPEPGSYQFLEGTVVNVTAIPEKDFILDHWELDGVNQGASNPVDVTMNANHTLLAVFKPLYTLTITCTTGGTTEPSPNTYQHKEGIVVEVTAIADSGYVFDHWELDAVDIGDDNPTMVTMNANHTLHAVFTQITCTLTISVTGEGTTDPAEGSHVYGSGSTATVSATPDPGWYLDHWTLDGEDAGSTMSIDVLMDSDHDLKAVFTQVTYTLTITTTTGGTTNPSPGSYVYSCCTNVSVTAIADPCYPFDHWKLGSSNAGSANPYTVHMDMNHTLTAVFVQKTFWLTIQVDGTGTTDPSPGSYEYDCCDYVSVTAIETDPCGKFDHWELDSTPVGSANSYTVTMNADHTLHAIFKEVPPVGGHAVPIDKSHFLTPKISLAPGIGLAFTFLAAMALIITLIRRRNKHSSGNPEGSVA